MAATAASRQLGNGHGSCHSLFSIRSTKWQSLAPSPFAHAETSDLRQESWISIGIPAEISIGTNLPFNSENKNMFFTR